MNTRIKRGALAVFFALGAAGVGAISTHLDQTSAAASEQFRSAATAPVSAAVSAPDFSALVDANRKAVVSIVSEGRHQPAMAEQDSGMPELPFNLPFPMPRQPEQRPSSGIGSGFIIGEDGYILTNNHVVEGAERITVHLADRRELPAKVIGTDPQTDVALLKIDATGLATVNIGDTSKLKVGQWVLAIGAPFGLDYTATQGIVSAMGRSLPSESYVPFIQTDVAVNPGNSGGPLFDSTGHVVGINSQIFSRTGGYMGLSFAIPIDVAMDVAGQLKTSGKVTRGWLGVTVQNVNADLARSFGLPQPRGALVSEAKSGTPAAESGLRSGDVIVRFGDKQIDDSGDLAPSVGRTRPGTRVPVTVLRDGREQKVDVTVGTLPDRDGAMKVANTDATPGKTKLGVMVSNLTEEQRRQLGVTGGVLVQQVGPGAAASAGVQPGDVLLRLNQDEIKDAAQLRQLVDQLPAGKPAALLVRRGEGSLFLPLEPHA